MFESVASNLLSGLLGRYVDVQRDQLRISLWNGASSSPVCRPAAQSSRRGTEGRSQEERTTRPRRPDARARSSDQQGER